MPAPRSNLLLCTRCVVAQVRHTDDAYPRDSLSHHHSGLNIRRRVARGVGEKKMKNRPNILPVRRD